eukprot:352035-Chlamydomonas_euryale.AAC.1
MWRNKALAAVHQVLTSRWRGRLGMGWLRTINNGVPFVIVPSALLNPLCLAALNTGIPFMRPLPVTLTLTLTSHFPALQHLQLGRRATAVAVAKSLSLLVRVRAIRRAPMQGMSVMAAAMCSLRGVPTCLQTLLMAVPVHSFLSDEDGSLAKHGSHHHIM